MLVFCVSFSYRADETRKELGRAQRRSESAIAHSFFRTHARTVPMSGLLESSAASMVQQQIQHTTLETRRKPIVLKTALENMCKIVSFLIQHGVFQTEANKVDRPFNFSIKNSKSKENFLIDLLYQNSWIHISHTPQKMHSECNGRERIRISGSKLGHFRTFWCIPEIEK